jgi:hypothetical protein
VDLNLFEFDYDLTWAAFFLNADEHVYGRYGGRDASGPDERISLDGLRHAMRAALAAHQRMPNAKPAAPRDRPLLAENYPAARRLRRGECIHCHQVYEFRREELQAAGRWTKDEVWVYPQPENVGLILDINAGDRVRAVAPDSPAGRAGLQPGDTLVSLNGVPVASIADAQYALHRAPRAGTIPVTWQRDGRALNGRLELTDGWRRTNITWRPSLLDGLPSLSLYGADLSAAEKKALGLSEKRLAFRQDAPVPRDMQAAGVRAGDIIIGIDHQPLEMTVDQFLGYVRRNYLAGERVTLNLIRDGKRVDLPLTLR